MFKIVTWNVNSIRQRILQLLKLLNDESIDVILLQELKCTKEQFPYLELEDAGYNCEVHGQKSYNGVAIISKYKILDVITTIPNNENDSNSRYIEALILKEDKVVRVASIYVPNGQSVDSEMFKYKLNFMNNLKLHADSLLKNKEMIIIAGDYNIAPYPIDVYDQQMDGSICYHPDERKIIREIMNLGYTDAFRLLHPNQYHYSWWDYRGSSFKYNKGMRIDYLLISSLVVDKVISCNILNKIRENNQPSDHAPVELIINI